MLKFQALDGMKKKRPTFPVNILDVIQISKRAGKDISKTMVKKLSKNWKRLFLMQNAEYKEVTR